MYVCMYCIRSHRRGGVVGVIVVVARRALELAGIVGQCPRGMGRVGKGRI